MKNWIIILILIVVISCSSVRYIDSNFTNQTYICDNGPMVGKNILILKERDFLFGERDSLFVGTGKWELSNDKKLIIIKGTISDKHNNPNNTISKSVNFSFVIKSKNKLELNGQYYFKK